MYSGKLVFAQAMDHLPLHTFRRCVQRYNGNQHIKSFTCQDQYRCMGFAQLTYRESLRDIEACLKIYVLVAIIKKRLNIKLSLYSILQILSLTLF
jgi:hypothetical protein